MSTQLATSGIANGAASGGAEKLAGLIKPMIEIPLTQVRGDIEKITIAIVEIRRMQERCDVTNHAMHKEMEIKMDTLSTKINIEHAETQAMLTEIANQQSQILDELRAFASQSRSQSLTSPALGTTVHTKVGGDDTHDNARNDNALTASHTTAHKDAGAADKVEFLKNLRIVHVNDLPANMFQKSDDYIPD